MLSQGLLEDETWNPAAQNRGFSSRVCPLDVDLESQAAPAGAELLCVLCANFPALLLWPRCRSEWKIRLSLLLSPKYKGKLQIWHGRTHQDRVKQQKKQV